MGSWIHGQYYVRLCSIRMCVRLRMYVCLRKSERNVYLVCLGKGDWRWEAGETATKRRDSWHIGRGQSRRRRKSWARVSPGPTCVWAAGSGCRLVPWSTTSLLLLQPAVWSTCRPAATYRHDLASLRELDCTGVRRPGSAAPGL